MSAPDSNQAAATAHPEHWLLPLELALIRWSVVGRCWSELSSGHAPILAAFLAGWCCRCCGVPRPSDEGVFRDSFRVGWREADDQIAIAARQLDSATSPDEMRSRLEDCAAFLAFHGPVGATPESAALLLRDVRKALVEKLPPVTISPPAAKGMP